MRRIALALSLALVVSLTLLPGAAWAWRNHVRVFVGPGFQSACCVFIRPGPPFAIRHGFIHPHFGPTFIVVNPAPQPVWVPSFWHWTGVQWVWLSGQWVFPGQGVLLRNPCD